MSAPDEQHLDPLDRLDRRAARAAGEVRALAAARPVPGFDPARAVVTELSAARPNRRGRWLAVAAAVVVAAAVAGLLVARSGDDGDDRAKIISGDPRPFVVADLPPGFALAGAGEITPDQQRASSGGGHVVDGPTTLYGPGDDDPLLAITASGGGETWQSDGGTDTDQDLDLGGGRIAHRFDGMGLGKRAWLVIDGDDAFMIVSPDLDETQMRALATEVTADGSGQVDLHGFDLPGGWKELGRFEAATGLTSSVMTMANPGATGKYVVYSRGTGSTSTGEKSSDTTGSDGRAPDPELPEATEPTGTMMVASTPGDELQLHAGAIAADSAEPATVRGHDAVLTSLRMDREGADPLTMRSVAWLEQPGEMVKVSGVGFTEDALLAAAESVEPVGKAAWKDLIEQSQMGAFDPANEGESAPVKVGEGTFADGSRWLLGARPPSGAEGSLPSVELSVTVADPGEMPSSSSGGGSGPEGPEPGAIVATQVVQSGGKAFVGVLVGPTVARVELQDGDGTVLATPEVVEGGGFRGVAVPVAPGTSDLVVFAADGTELARTSVRIGDGCDEEVTGSDGSTDAVQVCTDDASGSSGSGGSDPSGGGSSSSGSGGSSSSSGSAGGGGS